MLRTVDFLYIVFVVNGSCAKYCLRARHKGHLPRNKRQDIRTWSLCCKCFCTEDGFDQRMCVCEHQTLLKKLCIPVVLSLVLEEFSGFRIPLNSVN